MNDDLRTLLEQINQNLNTVIHNQALMYGKLESMEQAIKAPSSPGQE